MFENKIRNHQKLILTPCCQFKIDIYYLNIQFQSFIINIWCNFVLGFKDLKICTLEKDNFADLLVLELISPVLRNTEEIQRNKHFTSQKNDVIFHSFDQMNGSIVNWTLKDV